MDMFSGMFIVKIHLFHLMENLGGGGGRAEGEVEGEGMDPVENFSAHH